MTWTPPEPKRWHAYLTMQDVVSGRKWNVDVGRFEADSSGPALEIAESLAPTVENARMIEVCVREVM